MVSSSKTFLVMTGLLFILIIVMYSCNEKPVGKPIVAENPIFVETYSFTSGDHITPNESEYFLVKTNGNEEAFNKSVPPKYKIFLDNDDEQIVYYEYYNSHLLDRTIK